MMKTKNGKSLEEFILEGMPPEKIIEFMEKQVQQLLEINPDFIWNNLTAQFNRRKKNKLDE